jgi:hypothetical protein
MWKSEGLTDTLGAKMQKHLVQNKYRIEKYDLTVFSRRDYKYAIIAYSPRRKRNVGFYYESYEKAEKAKADFLKTAHWGLFDYVDLVTVELAAA